MRVHLFLFRLQVVRNVLNRLVKDRVVRALSEGKELTLQLPSAFRNRPDGLPLDFYRVQWKKHQENESRAKERDKQRQIEQQRRLHERVDGVPDGRHGKAGTHSSRRNSQTSSSKTPTTRRKRSHTEGSEISVDSHLTQARCVAGFVLANKHCHSVSGNFFVCSR